MADIHDRPSHQSHRSQGPLCPTFFPLPDTPLGLYRHYKGGEYEVIGVARHSETLEPLVVYRPLLQRHRLVGAPACDVLRDVDVDGQRRPRFEKVN